MAELVKTKEFHKLIEETTSEEADHIVDTLEKQLYNPDSNLVILYSLKEIETMVYDRKCRNDLRTEYLMLTDKYLAYCEDKNRIHRLLQISKNRKVKTRIVNVKTLAGKRVSQLGGLVFFATPTK